MENKRSIDFGKLPGYRWHENGQSAFSGALLTLYGRLDRLFLKWAAEYEATEYRFPTFISARDLDKLDYFRSFPHLATFPVTLAPDEENLASFARGAPLNPKGEIELEALAPIYDALTPAACYHFYIQFQGESLEAPRYVTTQATCFRRENYYAALERQWSFSMREIVCLGTADEVKAFLANYQGIVDRFLTRTALPVDWKEATDPFFNPSRNPKYLLQKLDPVKKEMIFQGRLAIGSMNFHRNYFGETFGIQREGKEAYSGCVAFGIERWMFAFLTQFGADEGGWPDLG